MQEHRTKFRKGDILSHDKGTVLREVTDVQSAKDGAPILLLDDEARFPHYADGWRVDVPFLVVGDIIAHTQKAFVGKVTHIKIDGNGKQCGVSFASQHGANLHKPLNNTIKRLLAVEDVPEVGERVENFEGCPGTVAKVDVAPYDACEPVTLVVSYDDEQHNETQSQVLYISDVRPTEQVKPVAPFEVGFIVMSRARFKRRVTAVRYYAGSWGLQIEGDDGVTLEVSPDGVELADWQVGDLMQALHDDGDAVTAHSVYRCADVYDGARLDRLDLAFIDNRGERSVEIAEAFEHVLEGYDGDVVAAEPRRLVPGDFVRCVRPQELTDLKDGGIYRVVNGGKIGLITLRHRPQVSYKPDRFELWTPAVGDLVRWEDEPDVYKVEEVDGTRVAARKLDAIHELTASDLTPVLADEELGPADVDVVPVWGFEQLKTLLAEGNSVTITIEPMGEGN